MAWHEEWKRMGHISGQFTSDLLLLKKKCRQGEARWQKDTEVRRGQVTGSLGSVPSGNRMPWEGFRAAASHGQSFV